MKSISKRLLSCLLAVTLLITCSIAGIVLPVSAVEYAEVGTNIAVNGDFETVDGTQWTNASPYGAKDGVGFGGSRGLELTADKKTLYYRTSLTLRPNAVYEVSFLAKGYYFSFGSGGASKLKNITIPGVASMSNILSTNTSADWVKYSFLFYTGDAPSYDKNYGFCFKRGSATTAGNESYVDNFEIRELSEEAQAEVIAGGDFSGYWSEEFVEMYKAAGITAGYTLEAEGENGYIKFPAAKAEAYLKSLAVSGGKDYTLSFKAKGGALGVYFSATHATAEKEWQTVEPGNEWKTYSFNFTTAASPTVGYIVMFAKGNAAMTAAGTDAATYIDDVSIKPAAAKPATAITLNKTELTLGVSGSETLSVVATPENGTYDAVVWTSSNEAVATVANGVVTAVAPGTATITATAGTLTATCAVTVPLAANGMSASHASLHLAPGTVKTVTAVADPVGADLGTLTWTSNNEAVATVDGGKITAVAAGEATITVSNGTLSATTVVKVSEEGELLTGGDFENNDWNVPLWTTNLIKAGAGTIVTETDGNTVLQLQPSNNAVYFQNFPVKGNTTYVFTYQFKGGTVRTSISATHSSAGTGWKNTSPEGEGWTTVTRVFTTKASPNKNFVMAIGATTATPTYIDNASLTTLPAATALKLDKTAETLSHNQTLQLTVSTEPEQANAGTLTWASNNEAVATVDQNGLVTAVGSGEATITVSNGTLSATCVITVPLIADAFTLKETALYFAPGTYKTLTVVTEGGLSAGALTWATADAAVATVDNGKVTAVGEGATTITATNYKNVTATVTVKVDAYGERLSGGDFENGDWNHATFTGNIVKDGAGSVITEADGNAVLQIPGDVTATLYFAPAPIVANKTYILTLKAKGKGLTTSVIAKHVAAGAGEKSATLKADEWTTVTRVFTTNGDPNKNYAVGLRNKSGEAVLIDNITWAELPDAESLLITPSAVELLPNGTSTLKVSAVPELSNMGAVTWSSSDPNVVSVDQEGNVTAVAKSGSVTITVTNDKNKTATATVTINPYANLLTNGDFELGNTLYYNADADLNELILPGIGKDGSWGLRMHNTSGKSKTTTYYRKALPLDPGTTYIITFDYLAAPNGSIRLWSGTMGFDNVYTSTGKKVWKTATKIFTTPADMALNTNWDLGIVCDDEGDESAVIDNISLKLYNSGVAAESITLSKNTLTLIPGRTGALAAHATPVDGDTNQMVWTSSNEDVATVEYGVVTGVGKGTAIITGTTKNGKSASCTVTVSGNETYVQNGTFDKKNDTSWTFADGAATAEGAGVSNSIAAQLVPGATLSQVINGEFKPETEYQLFVRYRTPNKSKASVVLADGTTKLVDDLTGESSYWKKLTYEFKTGATAPTSLTLTFALASGNGPVYIDNIILAQKASLVDLVVENIIWDGGDSQVKPGDKLTFATTIRNQGEDKMKRDQSFDVNICLDGKVIQTITYTGELDSGDSTIVISETAWTVAGLGDHTVSAHVNPTLTVLEIDDTNNTRQVNLRIANERLEAPEQAQVAGMTNLIFSDDFDSDKTIDKYATGDHGYKWYVTAKWGNGTAQPDDYTVKDGILKLHRGSTPNNITLSTMDINTGNGFSWNTGYLEFRLRVVDADGAQVHNVGNVPAVWSFPMEKHMEIAGKNKRYVEMDWMEYWGLDTAKWPTRPGGYYTISLHDCENSTDGLTAWFANSGSSGRYQEGLGDEEWHVMGFRWEKGKLAGYYDGEKVFEQKWGEGEQPKPNAPDQINGVLTPTEDVYTLIDRQFNILYLSAHEKNPMELDYVRIWQGDGSVVSPDDPEDGEEVDPDDVIVDIEPEQFWYNYCTDDWGDNITAVTEENYLNVLAGQALWEALTDARRAEINAYLKAQGQPSYDELLAAALAIQNGTDEEQSPATGATTALPAATAAAVLGAAALWLTRKRKHAK
ncbi:MAG: Ig-like domain-containing protein [Clostridia bacterium]|nr:Ig-like domain-containing protein [Clostridia bacterium]